MTRPATRSRPPAHHFTVLGVTTLGLFLIALNSSSVTIALPAMSHAFAVDATTANWFLIAFMLAQTASILVFGRISDLVGRKRIYLGGLVLFVLLCLVTPWAPNAGAVIVLRALQGIAAATTVVNTTAILADAFPSNRLAQGLSLNLTAAAVAQTIGPAVGGALVLAFGWQSVFLVNVPFGILAIVLGLRFVSARDGGHRASERFDFAGAALSAAGLGCLLYGVNELAGSAAGDYTPEAFIGGGVLLVVLFVVVETRVEHPLVDLGLVRNRARACAFGAAFFTSFALAGTTVLVALQLQVVSGFTAVGAGLVVTVLAVTQMAAALVAGRLARGYSLKVLSAAGGLSLVAGLLWLVVEINRGSIPALVGALSLIGFGVGLFTTPNTTSIMAGVASNRLAIANAIRSLAFNSAQALGTAVCLLLVTAFGVTSYASVVRTPEVQQGFQAGVLVLACSAVIALVLALARGGSWRLRQLP